MTDEREKRRALRRFVGSLTEREAREELYLAYLQMERCRQVLEGEDVRPVTMRENGLDSDLELYYACRRIREELDGVPRQLMYVVEERRDGRFRERSITFPGLKLEL